MRIAILGPTGGTGQQLVTQALDRGHEVVAVARRTGAVKTQHPRLRAVYGDVLAKSSLVPALAGAEAAIFAVGVASIWQARKPTTVYSAGDPT
jgi:biliverdin reductase/flavin reductase